MNVTLLASFAPNFTPSPVGVKFEPLIVTSMVPPLVNRPSEGVRLVTTGNDCEYACGEGNSARKSTSNALVVQILAPRSQERLGDVSGSSDERKNVEIVPSNELAQRLKVERITALSEIDAFRKKIFILSGTSTAHLCAKNCYNLL